MQGEEVPGGARRRAGGEGGWWSRIGRSCGSSEMVEQLASLAGSAYEVWHTLVDKVAERVMAEEKVVKASRRILHNGRVSG